MGLMFLGSMYRIFAPSSSEEVTPESVGGFNADIPLPKEDGIIGDKKAAYEQEQMQNKQADKMRSLQDFAFSLGEENKQGDDLNLIDDAPAEIPNGAVIDFGTGAPANNRSAVQSSAMAYRDMNRQLVTPTRHILPTILVPAHPGFANTSCKYTFSMLQTFFTRTFTFFMQHMLMLRTRWPNFFHARNVDYRPASAERSAR